MAMRPTRTRWLPAVSGAVAAMLAFAVLPAMALADDVLDPGPYSEDSQLSTGAYSALGLTVSDDTGDAGTYAPYGNDENVSTTLLSDDEVYMAANGARKNVYTLRGKLNQLCDANTDAEGLIGYTTISDDYGGMGGAYLFWPINELYGTSSDSGVAVDMVKKGVSYYSPLSDNENDVIKGATNNGFSGKYATSVSADLGSGYKDHVVELRAYGSQYYTTVGNQQLSGAFAVKVFSLDTAGNRTEVASLAPTVNENQIQASNYSDELAYLRAGYLQEYDAYFEVAAADVDGDGVDEAFCYTGCYKDENGERLACIDMWDLQSDGSWSHTQEWVDCGQASSYVTEHELDEIRNSKDDPTDRMQLMLAPVVTLAGGDLDRRGGEELAITVSAPMNHDNPTDAARCYIYTWDDTAKRLSVVVNDGLGNDYIPLSTTVGATSAMVSANCTFGTFSTSDTDTATALIIAGWDCGGSSNAEYANFGYRYVYYDTSQGDFVVSDYYRKALGKDAAHITETACKDSDQDGRYRPTLAPFALGAARLDGLNQGAAENDDVLMGGDIYSFSLSAGASLDTLGSISLTSDQVNSNRYTKGKEQVWIGDVRVGAVSGSDKYEESFLAVTGVHRDEDLGKNDDYYWMDVSHFSAKWSDGKFQGYTTGEEGVINESVRVHDTTEYGCWISLCLPNVDHDGMQVRFKASAEYYTAPQLLAVLQGSPYFQDLQDSYDYLNYGGTAFGSESSSTSGSGWSIEGEAGIFGEASGGFLGRVEVEGELKAHAGYEYQNSSTLSYGVDYDAHAAEGNKAVVYTVPIMYYWYEVSDSSSPEWTDVVMPVFLTPVTAVVSQETWDETVEEYNLDASVSSDSSTPLTYKISDVLSNKQGDPASYGVDALTKTTLLLSAKRAFTYQADGKDAWSIVSNEEGASTEQTIASENETEKTVDVGGSVALQIGAGFGIGKNEIVTGMVFELSGGYTTLKSSSTGFSFTGTVDNLPEAAEGYGFSWRLAVDQSSSDMPVDGTRPATNQFWIVGYDVTDVKQPEVPMVSGFATTGASYDSATGKDAVILSWNDILTPNQKANGYKYAVAMYPTTDDDHYSYAYTLDGSTTSYVWAGLSTSSNYRFAVFVVDGTGKQVSLRSPIVNVTTLPAGDAMAVDGVNILGQVNTSDASDASTSKATRRMGESLTLAMSGSYYDSASTALDKQPLFRWYRKEADKPFWQEISSGLTLSTQDNKTYTSTYAIDEVTAEDDGTVYRCDVSYNNIVVSSQTVTLDVTHTYSIADSGSTYTAIRMRINYLRPSKLKFFKPVAAEIESGLKPDEGGTTDNGAANDATDNGATDDLTAGAGASASAGTSTAAGSAKAGSTSGTPQTGDSAPGTGALALIALGGAAILVAALVVWHRSKKRS